MQIIKNMSGLSLPEILISMALVGGLSLGVVNIVQQSEKRKSQMDNMTSNFMVEKMLESYLYSPKGCDVLKNKKIGDSLDFRIGNLLYSPGSKIGQTEIESLKLENFYQTDEQGRRGMVRVILTMNRGTGAQARRSFKEIPVPVNVKNSGGVLEIEDCLLNKSSTFDAIVKRVCEGSFGQMTKGLNCTAAVAFVQKRLIEEICRDIYGGKATVVDGVSCNLKLVHAGQSCGPDGKVRSFDNQGNIVCGN